MRLIQYLSEEGKRRVGLVEEGTSVVRVLNNTSRVYDLALEAYRKRCRLEELVNDRKSDEKVDYGRVIVDRRLLPPLDHPDPAHCYVTGTGLTHLGSAEVRESMHDRVKDTEAKMTDSMRMFQMGLLGGKPPKGRVGIQPEWFYKGNGNCVVPPEHPLELPAFALSGGEEAELVGLYVVADSGDILRVGFALGNDFSDHVMEHQNYLYLAHSKLRQCSFGPELLIGSTPSSIQGRVRILRDGKVLWTDTFLTGEDHMSHTISNLEHHHFKYSMFRQPGDVHCHFFGTATLSYAAKIVAREGDIFEIYAEPFGQPLRNPLTRARCDSELVTVKQL